MTVGHAMDEMEDVEEQYGILSAQSFLYELWQAYNSMKSSSFPYLIATSLFTSHMVAPINTFCQYQLQYLITYLNSSVLVKREVLFRSSWLTAWELLPQGQAMSPLLHINEKKNANVMK